MVSLSRAASWASHLVRLKSSTTLETSCFGVCRSETFSDLARRSPPRARGRSRSVAPPPLRFSRAPPAFVRHRLHALVEALAGEKRNDQGVGGCACRDRGQQHGHEMWVVELGDQEINHAAPSEVEV